MKTLLIISTLLFFSACSTTKSEIAAEKNSYNTPADRSEMIEKTRSMLESSTRLSEKQKDDFIELHSKVIDQVFNITGEVRKLKLVFFNHLTNQDYKEKKVSELMKQIKKLNNKKFDLMADAMVDARKILGVEIKKYYKIMNRDVEHGTSVHY